jgi:asparagine synthase (glutamine-hydrolysing)
MVSGLLDQGRLMCGIAGIVAPDRLHPEERARIAGMRDVLAHRGPDEAGTRVDEQAALAHRRLSIIDLASGQQPLANEDETVWIVYNGEIYNHAEIRSELEAAGHRYRTRSDTETIVHAYEQWGDQCVHRLRGMFAFAIWDAPKRRLLLVRDRLGVKPLYWTIANNRLLFGSEIKSILQSGLIEPRANVAALPELLTTRYLSGDETLFRGIHRLMPGHLLVYQDGIVKTSQYWDIPIGGRPETQNKTLAALVEEFRARLEESVRLRLMSDVPLGMFLSGGLDSSVVAALMARMIDRPVETFSVAFSDRAFSELEYSRQVARAIGAHAHEVVVSERDFFGALPRLIWHEDEPIAHPSSVPLYFVSALARQHVKVVLTGEGSDELLAGYGKYPRSLLNWHAGRFYEAAVPRPLRRSVRRLAIPRLPARAQRFAERSFLAMDRTPEAIFFDAFAATRLQVLRPLLSADLRALATVQRAYGPSRACFDRPGRSASILDRVLYADLKTYLVELLMKQDQMSMAASIESRVPFLDHTLVEFAAGLPPQSKLRGFATKRILRAAAADLLPRTILERPKMGFPVPFAEWMRGPSIEIARQVLLDRRAIRRGLLNGAAVERLLTRHASGQEPAGGTIWSLLNLELWYRTAIDGAGVQALQVA